MTISSATLTVSDRVAAASSRGAVTFIAGDGSERISWAQLHEEATAVAATLEARGVGPGQRVALLGPTTRALVTTIQATWLAGATVVVLPLPMRMAGIDDFVAQTRARIRSADASLVVIDDDLAPFVEPAPGDPPMASLHDLVNGPRASYEQPTI